MKSRTIISIAAALAMAVACDRDSCPNPYLTGDTYTINSQEQVASFKGSDDINTLKIEGDGISDLSSLDVISLKNLVIKNTSIEHLCIPRLQSFSVSLQVLDNEKLVAVDGLENIKFAGGELLIKGNPVLTDIRSIMNLKVLNGNIRITENPELGENVVPLPSDEFGFGPLLKLINNSVTDKNHIILSNNHPDAVTDASMVGIPVGQTIIDYDLKSKKDLDNFVCFDADGIVHNLRIAGSDITPESIIALSSKVKEIRGTLTLENLTFADPGGEIGHFFRTVSMKGGLTVRNCPNLNNINTFQSLSGVIHGDLVIEDCPKFDYGWSNAYPAGAGFQKITKVEGGLVIKNAPKFISDGFRDLQEVGGNFHIEKGDEGGRTLWNFAGMKNLKKIGGDITLIKNKKVNSFLGFEKIAEIGAKNITISADVELKNADNGKPGFGWFKFALNKGIIKNKDCKFNFSKLDGTAIDFDSLEASER